MKSIFKSLMRAAMVTVCLASVCSVSARSIYFVDKDDSSKYVAFSLDDEPEVTFEGDNVCVKLTSGEKAGNYTVVTTLSKLGQMHFNGNDVTGAEAAKMPVAELTYKPTADGVVVCGAQGKTITMYNVNGMLISSINATSEETLVPTANLAPGTYVVNVDGHSFKLLKR